MHDHGDNMDRPGDPPKRAKATSDVLNDQAELGSKGKARSSGGIGASSFVKSGMAVLGKNGKQVGLVDRVEGDRIWLQGDANNDGRQEFVPFSLVDGVDDERVILSDWGDASFGMGASA